MLLIILKNRLPLISHAHRICSKYIKKLKNIHLREGYWQNQEQEKKALYLYSENILVILIYQALFQPANFHQLNATGPDLIYLKLFLWKRLKWAKGLDFNWQRGIPWTFQLSHFSICKSYLLAVYGYYNEQFNTSSFQLILVELF